MVPKKTNQLIVKFLIICIAILVQVPSLYAQESIFPPFQLHDYLSAEYATTPSLGRQSIQGLKLDFSKKLLSQVGLFEFKLSYKQSSLELNPSSVDLIPLESFERIHSSNGVVSFIRPLHTKGWLLRASIGATLSSTFKSELSSEDFIFNASLGLNKKWGAPVSGKGISFGLGYGTSLGRPLILPYFSYQNKPSYRWSYSLGFPLSQVNYNLSRSSTLSFSLRPDVIFANNTAAITLEDGVRLQNSKIQLTGLYSGFTYRVLLGENLLITTEAGMVSNSNLKITDSSFEEITTLKTDISPSLRTSIRYIFRKSKGENSGAKKVN